MLPAILGLGGLTAKIIATAVIPRVVRAISQSFSTTRPAEPCPPSPVEGISSGPEPAPAPVLSGVSGTQIRSRKWGYAGLWHHGPSGLDLATYRLYDAANKRWISRDPLGEGVDLNLYRYCGNSPINNVDPTGLDIRVTFEDNTQEWMTPLDLYVYTGGSIKCPKKIRKIEFEGHATPQMQGANPWDRYSKNGGLKLVRGSDGKDHVNLLVNGQDVGNFANRLRGMLTSDATLVLGGCRTCAEPNSITHVLNTETGRPVTGNGNYVYGTYVRGGFLDGGFWGNPQTIGR